MTYIPSPYLLRSLMFVPAHTNRLLDSAARSQADVLLLDLEDSVPGAQNKQIAREQNLLNRATAHMLAIELHYRATY